jgi:HTH-type transcriptional regulator / antitoxin HigA
MGKRTINKNKMIWFVLKTTADYQKAIRRTMEIFTAAPGSDEERELYLLLVLVKDYEDRRFILPDLDPIEVIKLKMTENGIKSKDLKQIIGSKGHVSSVLSGRRELTLTMAQKLKDYFQLPAEVFMPYRCEKTPEIVNKPRAGKTRPSRTKKKACNKVAQG